MTLTAPQAPEVVTFSRFLRPSEVIKATGLPVAVLYAALDSGELPSLDTSRPPKPGKKHKPRYLIDPADLANWIEAKKTRKGGK